LFRAPEAGLKASPIGIGEALTLISREAVVEVLGET
jgi:hypothetical protein